jgi:CheY-like chemotaxis protein
MLCVQVAEDNRINQKVLRMMLQANCAELAIVSDGRQAVDAYNKVLLLVLLLLLTLQQVPTTYNACRYRYFNSYRYSCHFYWLCNLRCSI